MTEFQFILSLPILSTILINRMSFLFCYYLLIFYRLATLLGALAARFLSKNIGKVHLLNVTYAFFMKCANNHLRNNSFIPVSGLKRL